MWNDQDPTHSINKSIAHLFQVDATDIYLCHEKIKDGAATASQLVRVPPSLMNQVVALLGTPNTADRPHWCPGDAGPSRVIPAANRAARGSSRPSPFIVDHWDVFVVRTSGGHTWLAEPPTGYCGFPGPDFDRLTRQTLTKADAQIAADSALFADLANAATSFEYYATQAGFYPTTTRMATDATRPASVVTAPGDHLVISTDGFNNYCIAGWNAQSSFTAQHPKVFDSARNGLQHDMAKCSQDFKITFSVP